MPAGRDLLRERVYARVLELILRGELQPGEKVVEERLGEELAVSRTPVREALRLLESEGYVRIVPHRGAVVAGISRVEVEEIYTIVSALEGLAVALAVPVMTAAEIDALSLMNRRLTALAKRGDVREFFALNRTFHAGILDRAPNKLVLEEISRFRTRIARFRVVSLSAHGRMRSSVDEHAAILRAIRSRRVDEARRLHERHVLSGREALVQALEYLPESLTLPRGVQ